MVVVAFEMRRVLPRTLLSLSRRYQVGVENLAYEVIVVDNGSGESVTSADLAEFGPEFRLLNVDLPRPSPAQAANIGMRSARGAVVGAMIDGARLLSPGSIRQLSAAARRDTFAILLGFHLGPDHQSRSITNGYTEATEDGLLDSIGWPADGYRLFDVCSLESSNPAGWFGPIAEATCFATHRDVIARLGGYDERFTSPGGGLVNHDLLARASGMNDLDIVVVLGEGTFHQIHGGVTTNSVVDRWAEYAAEFDAVTGERYRTAELSPTYVGRVPDRAAQWVGAAREVNRLLIGNEALQAQVQDLSAALAAAKGVAAKCAPIVSAEVLGELVGIHPDRWVEPRAIVEVEIMRSARSVRIEGWMPQRDPAAGDALMTVSLFGRTDTFHVSPGHFSARVSVLAPAGAVGRLTIDCSWDLVDDEAFSADTRSLAWRVFGITFEPSNDSAGIVADLPSVRLIGANAASMFDPAVALRPTVTGASGAIADGDAAVPWVEGRGTFNVDNLGDLLFPVVFDGVLRELHPRAVMTLASPLGGRVAGWSPQLLAEEFGPVAQVTRCLADDGLSSYRPMAPTAIVVLGGDVIHSDEHRFEMPDGSTAAYPYLQLASSLPLLGSTSAVGWHCAGVPVDPTGLLEERLAAGLGGLSAISVRDADSLRRVEALGAEARIVPDAVWALSLVWRRERLLARQRTLTEGGQLPESRYIAVHLSAWEYANLTPLVDAVNSVRDTDVQLVLISIGPCMGDDTTVQAVAARTGTWAFAGRDVPDRVAALAGAAGYIGMALHGGIVAASYGVPCVWLRDTPKARQASEDLGGRRLARVDEFSKIVRTMTEGGFLIEDSAREAIITRARDEVSRTLSTVLALADVAAPR